MSKVNWEDAPKDAEFYANSNFYWHDNNGVLVYTHFGSQFLYQNSSLSVTHLEKLPDYEPRPKEWPTDDRINNIGLNRTTEDTGHYEQAEKRQPKTSSDFLSACIQVQSQRAKQYDATGTGERSFQAAASAFNAVTGKDLKGSDVCLILEMVKLVRQYSSPDRLHVDSVLDKVSYSSLWAEQIAKELSGE